MAELEDKIIAALEDPRYDWRTVEGMAQETGVSEAVVMESLKRLADKVIESSTPDERGRSLFTTRRHYSRLNNFMKRSLSAATGIIRK